MSTRAWTGPSKRSLVQGCHWDPVNKRYHLVQADDVAGHPEQSVVFHLHDAAGGYLSRITAANAGHGSSIGLVCRPGVVEYWLGHATWGPGYITRRLNSTSWTYTKVPCLPQGDLTVDQADDLVCVRVKDRFRGYRLSSARKGKAELLWDIRIPYWMDRFQGHLVANRKLWIHRDVATKGASELRCYTFKGARLGRWDTSPWGDEAEGAMRKAGWIWSVSRTGGNNPARTVDCTPVQPE